MEILDIVVGYPELTHDSVIFEQSFLCFQFENKNLDLLLLRVVDNLADFINYRFSNQVRSC